MAGITFDVKGLPGPRGYSAYDIAVRNGFEGTEEEWLASLKSDTPGPAGAKPQITSVKENGVTTIFADDEPVGTVNDGTNGEDGEDGADGVTITGVTADENGCLHFTFNRGDPIVTESVKGAPGYSPVKGTDYWTAEDIAAITEAACDAAIAAYPIAEEVGF